MTSQPAPHGAGRALWTFGAGLAPVVLVWACLVGWLATLLYDRADWSEQADRATVQEWIDEARIFRKTLPDLARDYARLRDEAPASGPPDPLLADRLREKHDEIREQMRALAEPIRAYPGQLPSFPTVYRLEVNFPAGAGAESERIAWESPLPRPGRDSENRVRDLDYEPAGVPPGRARIRCEYQLHAFNRLQRQEGERRRVGFVAGAVLIAATLLAVLLVSQFLQRERLREVERLTAQAQAEHQQREVLEVRLRQRDAELQRDELDRKLLHQELEAATLQKRADEAEKSTLEMKSQLYAGIGIMAGSYAHNIKNLLVRPNDLLARCLESGGLGRDQSHMLEEVRGTLGTVTERLQQILRTVRRDPRQAERGRLDLAALARDTARTWGETGRDKWKLTLTLEGSAEPLPVWGDLSHLQQAVENLVFNARDAVFEMRSHLRDEARRTPDAAERRRRLIAAAGWVGTIAVAARRDGDFAVLEVRDDGVGMTDEVRRQCLQTHFSTKRDNALYEGYSAGMGLGLSFVATVLEHHRADLTIESEPLRGTAFRARFPLAGPEMADGAESFAHRGG